MSRRACLRQDDVAIHRVSQGCGGGRAQKKEGHGCVDTGDDEVAAGARWISVLGPEHCCCCVGPERDAAKRPLRLRGRTGREVNLR